ncbi:MAG: UDP-N-acetylglucosamine 2-epimerase (hydrolyzing) [Proteobacteria bacterium]|nr:UDP-N-acetylglucosamine 2-epimerase (hydrolyzing) [Pseudomonadota bacterium]
MSNSSEANVKRILFLTGTRADFGKLKPLMTAVREDSEFECQLFVTGMHTLERYGRTVKEVRDSGFDNPYVYVNQILDEPMDLVLANTIHGLGRYVHDSPPDLIVVHGDRPEALAGAIVGSIRNIRTAHIEGGELSGTIDGLIRHSVSKLAHLHFVANEAAAQRLMRMGESRDSIFVIGSPDIDVMLSQSLPSLEMVRSRYEIEFDRYAIAIFHPVTTEVGAIARHANQFVDSLLESGENFVVIYPNNDSGTLEILGAYERLRNSPQFRILPSLRFEYFVSLLKNARFIVGNSSAGVREAPVFGVPSVDVGTRQKGRFAHQSIISVGNDSNEIVEGIKRVLTLGPVASTGYFGDGRSALKFMHALRSPEVWRRDVQKSFVDRE